MRRNSGRMFARTRLVQPFTVTAIVLCCAALPLLVQGYSLSPRGTKYEQHVARQYSDWYQRAVMKLGRQGALHFSEPVHEEITNRIYGCGDADFCDDPEVEFAGPFILGGVRWNDDPPFQLQPGEGRHTSCKTAETIRFTTQPLCWYQLFKAARLQTASGHPPAANNHAPLLARSHFGDLQFLHAMASEDGETAAETQKRIMMWAEFAWKVAIGEYGLDTSLQQVDVAGFQDFFGNSGWAVQDLFTVGNPALRQHITDVAFGSILHTVEDSFAKGHVAREPAASGGNCGGTTDLRAPARIVEFHSYGNQDEQKHAQYDTREAFQQESRADNPNVVAVGRPLRGLYEHKASWETVEPYFACIFAAVDPNTKASAGAEFAAQ